MSGIPCVVYAYTHNGGRVAVAYTPTYRQAKRVEKKVREHWDHGTGITEAWHWPAVLDGRRAMSGGATCGCDQ